MKINSENNNSAVLSELGARIKRNRIDMQLSQQDFAAKAGISTRTLSAAENARECQEPMKAKTHQNGNGAMKNDLCRSYVMGHEDRHCRTA